MAVVDSGQVVRVLSCLSGVPELELNCGPLLIRPFGLEMGQFHSPYVVRAFR